MTPDQTSFERTHVPGALELHGLEKASSALSSGQWSGTCLIRGHFGRGHFSLNIYILSLVRVEIRNPPVSY